MMPSPNHNKSEDYDEEEQDRLPPSDGGYED